MPDTNVTSDDLTVLSAVAKREAAARNLVVLPAMMRAEAQVLFPHPDVTIGQALDVAVRAGAAFVTVDVLPFDTAVFLVAAVEDAEDLVDVPDELLDAAEEHEGEVMAVWVRFVADGTSYAFAAIATWHRDLTERFEEWADGESEAKDQENAAVVERMSKLSDAVCARPEMRGAKVSDRGRVAEALARELAGADDDEPTIRAAASWSATRIRDEAGSAYFGISQDVAGAAADVATYEEWQTGRTATIRRAFIRDLLTERTGGYSPTDALVKRIDEVALTSAGH